MKIHNLLKPEFIIPDLKSTTREDILTEFAEFLKNKKLISHEKVLFEKFMQRENLGSTAIGDGVAIPHCKLKGIKTPILMFALSKKGIDFFAPDKKPSQIFFVLVSSPENPSLNLQILAAIAHLVRKGKGLKKKILAAENDGEIMAILREEEDRLND